MKSPEMPTQPGKYIVRCMETDQEPQLVTVYKFKGGLWVDDPDIGKNPINHYHNGLTDITWEKLSL